ncbi:Xaa-Pro peptidase family protein [Aestuariibacter halophilus]|uniref:Xaa-Pro peptidase family protein n=1 Tax=Fluctibacter halophilus TaxID=226011 RepID=A0ABS8G3I4_9ALTE|nr:Xaa-Pro peptidase family protein [Aestuariibacter halophilus]MCC2615018.1 Xaa-Pro peptidase family protein [Aestuariibacter halophilus]
MTHAEQQHYQAIEQDSLYERRPEAIAPAVYTVRIAALQQALVAEQLDACLLACGGNLRYFTGLDWRATERFVGCLVTPQAVIAVCPAFERDSHIASQAIETEYALWQEEASVIELVLTLLEKQGSRTLALDPNVSADVVLRLQSTAQAPHISDASTLLAGFRQCKSAQELALIQHAMDITLRVHQLAYQFIQPGVLASEVKRFIDNAHRQLGADNGSTFCAVQFGQATAYPHGVPGDQRLEDNQLVLVDTGCTVHGYHSDITRTYSVGQVSQQIRDTWQIEKQAQAAAFAAARIGAPCGSVDDAARAVATRCGLGPDYTLPGMPHRTGHGIGLEIHEGPYLVRGDNTLLAAGMCFSNEPMIVYPDQFGVRLEDHFYMTDDGPRWFTQPQWQLDKPFAPLTQD